MAQPFLGEIKMFAGNFQIRGWVFCNGQLLSIANYDALYTLLGTTYGGDGVNTFGVPDLRGRVPVHMGSGAGLTTRTQGQSGGAETVTLTTNQVPAHKHTAAAQSTSATQASPGGGVWAAASQLRYSSGTPNVTLNANAGGFTGGGQAHENMIPFLAVNFIIATEGVYPQSN